jgi:hypothetical protein
MIEPEMIGENLRFLIDQAQATPLASPNAIDFRMVPRSAIPIVPTSAACRSDAGGAGWRGLS